VGMDSLECFTPAHEHGSTELRASNTPHEWSSEFFKFTYIFPGFVMDSSHIDGATAPIVDKPAALSFAMHEAASKRKCLPQQAHVSMDLHSDVWFTKQSPVSTGIGTLSWSSEPLDSEKSATDTEHEGPVALRSVSPTHISQGDNLVTVIGKGFDAHRHVRLCIAHFALQPVVISSAIAVCDVPYGVKGLVTVGCAKQSMGDAHVITSPPTRTPVLVTPTEGPEVGGTLVAFKGPIIADDSLASISHCRVGTIGPVTARWQSHDVLQCITPAHVPLSLHISLSTVHVPWFGA